MRTGLRGSDNPSLHLFSPVQTQEREETNVQLCKCAVHQHMDVVLPSNSDTDEAGDLSSPCPPYHVTLTHINLCHKFEIASDVTILRCICGGAACTPHWIVVVAPKEALLTATNAVGVHRAVIPIPLVHDGPGSDVSLRDTLTRAYRCMRSRSLSLGTSSPQWKWFVAFVDVVGNVSYYACTDASCVAGVNPKA